MAAEFDILNDFLRRFAPPGPAEEVSGRDAGGSEITGPGAGGAVPAEVVEQMRRLARGECPPEERLTLCRLLDEHREWIGQLASIVRSLATNGTPSGSPPSLPPPAEC